MKLECGNVQNGRKNWMWTMDKVIVLNFECMCWSVGLNIMYDMARNWSCMYCNGNYDVVWIEEEC